MPSGTWYIISREIQNSYPPNDAQNTPEDFLFRAPRKDFQSLGTMQWAALYEPLGCFIKQAYPYTLYSYSLKYLKIEP